jgi:hypothetical protein
MANFSGEKTPSDGGKGRPASDEDLSVFTSQTPSETGEGVVEERRSSDGPPFVALGGGVAAME